MPISRRALLAAGGATALGAGAGFGGVIVSRSPGSGSPAAPAPTRAATQGATASVPPRSVTPLPSPTPVPRGGTVRRTSPYPFSFDTFDASRSGELSTLEVLARTHSRLVSWSEFPAGGSLGAVSGDLAARWEQPSETRLMLHLDPAARWQASGNLPPRPVTAQDVVQHLQRAIALAVEPSPPAVQRAWDYASFASVSSPADGVVAIELARPDPFVLETLASRFALVQRPEAVTAFAASWHEQRTESAAGSGPWVLELFDGARLAFRASDAGHRLPFLDALEVLAPVRRVGSAALLDRDEWLLRDRRELGAVRNTAGSGWSESPVLADSPVISTFDVGAPPWNDPRMIGALDYALDREFLAEALFGGRALASSVIPAQFGLLPVANAAGFGVSDSDAKEARHLWTAAGGENGGPLFLDVPSIFDPAFNAGATVAARLREVLGVEVRPGGESYTAIARKSADHYYGNGRAAMWIGWGPPILEPSAARWLAETYASTSATAAGHRYANASADAAILAIQQETVAEIRARRMQDLAETIANDRSGGVITWTTQRFELLRSGAVTWRTATPFADQHLDSAISRV